VTIKIVLFASIWVGSVKTILTALGMSRRAASAPPDEISGAN
jgi:hypothetical protein